MKFAVSILFLMVAFAPTQQVSAQTPTNWYVRADGGSRYSVKKPKGQCDGKHNAPYSGKGVNQPCAYNKVSYLAFDGDYTVAPRWAIAGGDIVHIAAGQFRVGYNTSTASGYDGTSIAGNPYGSGLPAIPGGTPGHPTTFIGAGIDKTQIFAGYGAGSAFEISSPYITIQDMEITDHSQCSRTGTVGPFCSNNYPLDDYAGAGITTNKAAHDIILKNLNIHGFVSRGIIGPIGGLVTVNNVRIAFNGGGGWDFDDGGGTQSINNAQVNATKLTVEWNGCNEEYPIKDPIPALNCSDQNNAGYGDAIGTPGTALNFTCDQCLFRYNTQDGFDLLHTSGSVTKVTNSQSYGNMGQQWKLGAMKTVIFQNNTTVHNCRRLSAPMAGAPANYNKGLSLFCRAAGDGFGMLINDNGTYTVQNNSFAGYGATSYDIECSGTCTKPVIIFQNNLHIGYRDAGDAEHKLPAVFYWVGDGTHKLASPFLKASNNIYYRMRSLPADGVGTDPHIANEPAWTGEASLDAIDFHLTSRSLNAIGKGASIAGLTKDLSGTQRSTTRPSIGAFEGVGAVTASK